MTDEGLVEGVETPEPLPDDAEQLKALTEAGQLGIAVGELEKAAEAPAEEETSQDPPNEPDGPEEESAEEAELIEGVLVPANGVEYEKVFRAWVAAGKPRKFDALGIRWMGVEDGDHMKFVVAGGKAGMENYNSLSIGGR